MTTDKIDTSKLLGFSRKGDPLFDILVVSTGDLAQARAVGIGKAEGGAKPSGATKLAGAVKT
jgi:hypothetical protein